MAGITLLEVILVIALLVVIVAIYFPALREIKTHSDLIVTTNVIIDSLRRAQGKSLAGESDSAWGTKIGPSKITIFKGTTYVGREPSFDETFLLPRQIINLGTDEFFFNKITGLPNLISAISLLVGSTLVNIQINGQGVLNN